MEVSPFRALTHHGVEIYPIICDTVEMEVSPFRALTHDSINFFKIRMNVAVFRGLTI